MRAIRGQKHEKRHEGTHVPRAPGTALSERGYTPPAPARRRMRPDAAKPRTELPPLPGARHLETDTPLIPATAKRTAWWRRPRVLALLVTPLALGMLALWAVTTPRFQVRTVRIEGTSDPQLIAAIRALPLGGCDVFRCDTAARRRAVVALPAVADAEVSAVLPDTLVVRVTPRQPALVWQADGQGIVLAADGVVLGTTRSNPAYAKLSLPAMDDPQSALFAGRIPAPGQRIDPALVEMARQLRRDATEVLRDGWTLRYSGDLGFVAERADGARALFGGPADAATAVQPGAGPAGLGATTPDAATAGRGAARQIATLRALLDTLAKSGQRATLIDLRWGAHPYYRTG
jgi:POTRA domain-containing FtsQ-type protein